MRLQDAEARLASLGPALRGLPAVRSFRSAISPRKSTRACRIYIGLAPSILSEAIVHTKADMQGERVTAGQRGAE